MIEVATQIPVLLGCVLLIGGWRLARIFAFPMGFLIFAAPPPGWVMDAVTVPLKTWIADLVTNFLYALDYPIAQNGVEIMIGSYQLMVKDACSGINSIFALSAIGFFYVHEFVRGSWVRGAILIASIVPISVLANFFRVLALVLGAYYLGVDRIDGHLALRFCARSVLRPRRRADQPRLPFQEGVGFVPRGRPNLCRGMRDAPGMRRANVWKANGDELFLMSRVTEKAGRSNLSRFVVTVMAIVVASLGVRFALPPQSTTTPEFSQRQAQAELPNVAFREGDDHPRTLADFRSKVVLLNVWATWCPPCRKEMPSLDRLQAQLGGDDFEVIPLSVDRGGAEAVRRFFVANGVRHLAVDVDPSTEAQTALGIPGLPTTILIDREGREVGRFVGAADWDSPKVVSLLKSTIAGKTVSARLLQ